MNKPSAQEGFIKKAEPVQEAAGIVDMATGAAIDPDPPKAEWPVKVRLLHKPVRANNGDMVKELTFREPTGGDINRYGNPCHVNQEGEVIILDKKMITMMAVLSGVLQPFLEGMDPRDYNSCAYRLRSFFLPDPASW